MGMMVHCLPAINRAAGWRSTRQATSTSAISAASLGRGMFGATKRMSSGQGRIQPTPLQPNAAHRNDGLGAGAVLRVAGSE
jgi:hypothetical protein